MDSRGVRQIWKSGREGNRDYRRAAVGEFRQGYLGIIPKKWGWVRGGSDGRGDRGNRGWWRSDGVVGDGKVVRNPAGRMSVREFEGKRRSRLIVEEGDGRMVVGRWEVCKG